MEPSSYKSRSFASLTWAIRYISQQTVPCLSDVLNHWHIQQKQKLGPCQSPQKCKIKGKPTPETSCQTCVDWGIAIQAVSYQSETLSWHNINPTLLYHDPMEVAKVFALTECQKTSSLQEFDTTSLLMLMSNFVNFYAGNSTFQENIRKVSIRPDPKSRQV